MVVVVVPFASSATVVVVTIILASVVEGVVLVHLKSSLRWFWGARQRGNDV